MCAQRICIYLTAGKICCILVPLTLFLKHFSTGKRTLSATSSLAGCKVYTSNRRAGAIFSLTTSGMVKVPFWSVRREKGTNKERSTKICCSSNHPQLAYICTSQGSNLYLGNKLKNPGFARR